MSKAAIAVMTALASLVFALVALLPPAPARAEEPPVAVLLDGAPLVFDVPGEIRDGRTFVPLRGIFEALGATVTWDGASQTVTAVRGADSLKLTVGSRVVEWRRSVIKMDVAPIIVDGRVLVPLRFIGQALGIHVWWDGPSRTVHLEWSPSDQRLARGIQIVHEKSCMVCHTINGVGGNVGPTLNGVMDRFDEESMRKWLRNPQAVRDGSRMPNFGFSDEELEAVIAYLKALP